MGKLFGTDGIRGRVNRYPMTSQIALNTGMATGVYCRKNGSKTHYRAVLGRDSRASGDMLASAVASGLLSMDVEVLLVGVLPTPAISYLVKALDADCGVMITASHNPATDNGIKIFARDGFKLAEEDTLELESLILNEDELLALLPENPKASIKYINDAGRIYWDFARNSIEKYSLRGLKMVLDCANGAASFIAEDIFRSLGAEVILCNAQPDGENINCNCGAVYPENACKVLTEHQADLAVILDGDADRVIFGDARGQVVDGDRIIGMAVLDAQERGSLKNNQCAVTSMTNLGFHKAMQQHNIEVITTDVGDHLVIEAMRKNNCSIGGEQSGHIIFMDYVTTGDGIITALHIMKMLKERNQPLHELADFMTPFPQKMINLIVSNKKPFELMSKTNCVLKDMLKELGNTARAVVRFSGTENKLRILVEAQTVADMEKYCDLLQRAALEDLESEK